MRDRHIPTFSICIPNYNYGRYIGETIESVLNQTYQNFEIIVADNASTDNSVEVVQRFKDERIRLIRNRYNIGFAPNLQRVTMFARNEYINLLSSDDQMKPNALECYAEVLKELGGRAERAVLYSDVEVFNDRGEIIRVSQKGRWAWAAGVAASAGEVPYLVYRGRDVLIESLRRLRTFAPFLSVVYSKKLWEAVEGYNSIRTIGPDKHFNYKLLSLDPTVAYVPRVLFRYRDFESDNRASQKTTLKQAIDDYLYTLEFSEVYLSSLGLSRNEIIRTFLDRVCLREGLSLLGRRNYAQAFRLLAFALASYPGTTLRLPNTYPLMLLLGLGPLSLVVAPVLYTAYKRLRPDGEGKISPVSEPARR
jgi:glycosyltransferase involved in cell wall biosynthesis